MSIGIKLIVESCLIALLLYTTPVFATDCTTVCRAPSQLSTPAHLLTPEQRRCCPGLCCQGDLSTRADIIKHSNQQVHTTKQEKLK